MPHQDQVTSSEGLALRREINAVAEMTTSIERRVDNVQEELTAKMAEALKSAVASLPMPSEEEREYLRLATRAAARREKLQQAIIDKTLTAMVWTLLAGLAVGLWTLVKEYAITHFHFPPPKP